MDRYRELVRVYDSSRIYILRFEVSMYGLNLSLTAIAFILHIIIDYIEDTIGDDFQLPFSMQTLIERLRSTRPFQLKGLYFDPQSYAAIYPHFDVYYRFYRLLTDVDDESESIDNFTTTTITVDQHAMSATPPSMNHIDSETTTSVNDKQQQNDVYLSPQLYIIRRLFFFIFLIIYIIAIPICLM